MLITTTYRFKTAVAFTPVVVKEATRAEFVTESYQANDI